ncbi:hypothetical protein Ddc_05560 [Ditylenchus destructor]|nr:hypothetical protein Ddc_05560 [Ditylenchus destructor]
MEDESTPLWVYRNRFDRCLCNIAVKSAHIASNLSEGAASNSLVLSRDDHLSCSFVSVFALLQHAVFGVTCGGTERLPYRPGVLFIQENTNRKRAEGQILLPLHCAISNGLVGEWGGRATNFPPCCQRPNERSKSPLP